MSDAAAFAIVTAAHLARMSSDGARRELIDGVVIMMSPAGGRHGMVAANLGRLLGNHVTKHFQEPQYFVANEKLGPFWARPSRIQCPFTTRFEGSVSTAGETLARFTFGVSHCSTRVSQTRLQAMTM